MTMSSGAGTLAAMHRFSCIVIVVAALAVMALPAGAGAFDNPPVPPASDFVAHVDNPWFPLPPETELRYRGTDDDRPALDRVVVTDSRKTILGVRVTVVLDRLYIEGILREDTQDWYAQDKAGNVWYLGEDTKELDPNGKVISTEGSWQAGVDGAIPGVIMPADPQVGQHFRQEFYKGHAEDEFEILSMSASITTPFVSSDQAMLTKETTPLEPDVVDNKYYVRGIGEVAERTVQGGNDHQELVSVIHDTDTEGDDEDNGDNQGDDEGNGDNQGDDNGNGDHHGDAEDNGDAERHDGDVGTHGDGHVMSPPTDAGGDQSGAASTGQTPPGAPPASGPPQESAAAPAPCLDAAPPRTTLSRRGVRLAGHRLSLRGKAGDRGPCGGRVDRVLVSVAEVSGGTCRFFGPDGTLTAPRSCRRPLVLPAEGTDRWTFDRTLSLRLGARYRVQARAVDAAGNKETPKAGRNIVKFRAG
jgi:hypothetical protein